MFSDNIAKWCKVYTKTPDFKNHIKGLDNFRQAVKRPTSKRLIDYIPLAKKLNTEDLFKITFNYLCENSPNF